MLTDFNFFFNFLMIWGIKLCTAMQSPCSRAGRRAVKGRKCKLRGSAAATSLLCPLVRRKCGRRTSHQMDTDGRVLRVPLPQIKSCGGLRCPPPWPQLLSPSSSNSNPRKSTTPQVHALPGRPCTTAYTGIYDLKNYFNSNKHVCLSLLSVVFCWTETVDTGTEKWVWY